MVAFLDGDENDSKVIAKFMEPFRRLSNMGASGLTIHHDGKSENAKDFRGSSYYRGALDQAFHCSNIGLDDRLDRISLRCFKSRFGFGGSVIYRYAGGRCIRDEGVDAVAKNTAAKLESILRMNPGINAGDFDDKALKVGIPRQQARDFIEAGVLSKKIRRESSGRGNSQHFFLTEDAR